MVLCSAVWQWLLWRSQSSGFREPVLRRTEAQSMMLDFWEFAYERQRIWRRRTIDRLPWPWTDDPVLQKYRFTNVHRELDRGTITLRRLVHSQLTRTSLEAVVYNTMAYRVFNRAEMWEEVRPFAATRGDIASTRNMIRHYVENGGKIAPAAWTVSPLTHLPGDTWLERAFAGMDRWDTYAITEGLRDCATFMEAFKLMKGIPLMGHVLRVQCILDFTYLFPFTDDEEFPLYSSAGKHKGKREEWDPIGPAEGLKSAGGLSLYDLRHRQTELLLNRGLDWRIVMWDAKPHLTVADIEHTLCEYSKYVAVHRNPRKAMRLFRHE